MVAAVPRTTGRFWASPRHVLLTYAAGLIAVVGVACSTAQLKQAPPPGASPEGPDECFAEEGETCEGDAPAPPTPGLDAGRGPATIADGGAVPLSTGVTIQVQPTDRGAALLAAIRAAKTSVHMTMYLLSNDDVIDALGDLKAAGKDVKVVLNKTFPPNGGDNQPAFNALTSRGVSVKWAPSAYTFTHAKTILIDSEKAFIMTMNLTYTSPTTNREYIATDTDPADVADLEKVFDADYNNKTVNLQSKLVLSPQGANKFDAREHLTAFINSATTSLDVEMQTLSDEGIVDAIILAHEAKVATHVVIDGDVSDSPAQVKAINKLKEHGVPLRSLRSPDMHAKVIVVDDAKAWVGSQNMTSTALFQNREVGVLTGTKSEATKVKATITADFDKATPL